MKRNSVMILIAALAFSFPFAVSCAAPVEDIQLKDNMVRLEKLHKTDAVVWGFDFFGKNKVVFTEKSGVVKVLDLSIKKAKTVKNVPKSTLAGQGGMMDVLVDKDFENNQRIFLSYTVEEKGKYSTRLASAKLEGAKLVNVQILFTAQPYYSETRHFGSRIIQTEKGEIFLTVGDRGNREKAQDLSTHNGTVLRLTDTGSAYPDNPFVDQDKALNEIFTYGHRNAQGATLHPESKELYIVEHGPRGGDELNLIAEGNNYGWPVITYGREYWGPKIGPTHKEGMEQPLYHYTPSIAVSGLVIHSGNSIPEWKGNFFVGALKDTHISRLVKKGDSFSEREKILEDWGQRIRQIKEGPDGWLYLSTDSGHIARLVKKTP